MCYLARQERLSAADHWATHPEHVRTVRPRWVGAGAAALVAVFAAAALLVPHGDAVSVPAASVDRTSISPDDGLPTQADEAARAEARKNCQYEI